MKITHALAIAAGMAMLSACGSGEEAAENEGMTLEANTLVVDNLSNTDMNAAMNADMNMSAEDHSNMDMTTNTDAAAGNTTNNSY